MSVSSPGQSDPDARLVDAYRVLAAEGSGRPTDRMLAARAGLSPRNTKKRRLRMVHRGVWPGPQRPGRKTTPAMEAFIKVLASSVNRPTWAAIAARTEARFGRSIHPKTVEQIARRPGRDLLNTIAARIRAEAVAEYHRRHASDRPLGEPVAVIMSQYPSLIVRDGCRRLLPGSL